ncbi:hypothetical protein PT974_10488 [Cladobotryum mycophilum]|uniref:DUF676 domain-containing protein n=1 Tax=Cladobotryum mycophilum TaxID=491253 RepID=A0ABR0S9Z9_9HYPO
MDQAGRLPVDQGPAIAVGAEGEGPTRPHDSQSTTESRDASMKEQKESITFRVCGVPVDWDRERLQSFLANQGITDIEIESLALEANTSSQTATLSFQTVPSKLRNNSSWSILLSKAPDTESIGKEYLTFDKAFLGMTTLFAPPLKDHQVETCFRVIQRERGSHMWLRDSLPYGLTSEIDKRPMARIMVFGYESTVAGSQSIQNLEDIATKFHRSLNTLANATTTRPIILIGHSLGGLIIKQILISLSRSDFEEDKKLIRAIYGVVFFRTPHNGMDIESLIPMVGDGPNRSLIESLDHINSHILSIQQRDFHKALGIEGESEVFCFYETLKSPTAKKDESGVWKMNGPTTVLVTKSSATYCRP